MSLRRRVMALVVAMLGALVVVGAAEATVAGDATLARRGIAVGLKNHWLRSRDAERYRRDVARALRDVSRLPKLRGRVIAAQLAQVTTLWDSYTSPRALTLFSQLEENLSYLETHRIPAPKTDVRDEDGVVYRYFAGQGFEFHPLAAFGALNNAAAAQDVEATRTLADALVARAIPRGGRLLWEYSFRFGSGRPPWASGMAQAVAAQALARSSALLSDPGLAAAAAKAYASVSPLTLGLPSGPWVRLYGFDREVVLNAQLQAIVSLDEYAQTTGDVQAQTLAASMAGAAQALLPRFDTGDWSRYELGGAYAPREYQEFVTELLAKLAAQTGEPYWAETAQRFHDYLYTAPQVTPGAPPPLYPQPQDGWLDVASIPIELSQRASVTLSIGGKVTTYRLGPGPHTLQWTPPAGSAPASYQASISAVSYAGNRSTVKLAPIVVAAEAAPQLVVQPLDGTNLSWQWTDPGTPWLALKVDLVDPAGVNPAQTLDLGQQPSLGTPTSGSAQLALPPGTWHATLTGTNSAGLAATVDLGTVVVPG